MIIQIPPKLTNKGLMKYFKPAEEVNRVHTKRFLHSTTASEKIVECIN